jgi:hypothetical protein
MDMAVCRCGGGHTQRTFENFLPCRGEHDSMPLRGGRTLFENLLYLRLEAHVEHAIRLVQDHVPHLV